jgi:alpha-methylacyl-CoA racemase
MVDGAAYLMTMFHAMRSIGAFDENARGANLLDTGAHFYDVFECSDGMYVSLGSIEPQFYALLLKATGLESDPDFARQMDKAMWPTLKARLGDVMKTKTQAEWCEIMEHTDICFAPVLTMTQATQHPHNVARQTFVEVAGALQPAPAPRFSRTVSEISRPPAQPGEHTREVLADLGWSAGDIEALMASGAVA